MRGIRFRTKMAIHYEVIFKIQVFLMPVVIYFIESPSVESVSWILVGIKSSNRKIRAKSLLLRNLALGEFAHRMEEHHKKPKSGPVIDLEDIFKYLMLLSTCKNPSSLDHIVFSIRTQELIGIYAKKIMRCDEKEEKSLKSFLHGEICSFFRRYEFFDKRLHARAFVRAENLFFS